MSATDRTATIPGKEVDITYGEYNLRMFLDMGVGIGGDKWPAAEKFCTTITQERWKAFFQALLDGKRILELGSGNGFTGILVDKAFAAKEIVITDLDSHIGHIQSNIARNDCKDTTVAVAYDWTADPSLMDERLKEKFDVILALECVYREDLYLPLIQTIKRQSHKQTVCFLGSTRQFTKPSFFTMLSEHGLAYKKLPSNMLPEELVDESIGMFVIHLE
jgi:2-polyprenyl-3-methyl-5-hydroxy-6-metoxy-1,4-benzoquinol methylase